MIDGIVKWWKEMDKRYHMVQITLALLTTLLLIAGMGIWA